MTWIRIQVQRHLLNTNNITSKIFHIGILNRIDSILKIWNQKFNNDTIKLIKNHILLNKKICKNNVDKKNN